jgi:hypothetical protein
MKKLVKSIALVFIALSVAVATPVEIKNTTNPQSFKVGMYNVKDSHILKVFVEKTKGENLKMELKDKNGTTIASKYLSKADTKLGVNFDLSDLKAETYTLEIFNKEEKLVKEINLQKVETVMVDKKIVF